MRILYISNSSSVSGAPAALANIVGQLHGRHEVAVMLPDTDGPLYKLLSDMGVRCYVGPKYNLTIWPRVLNPVKFIRRICALTTGMRKVRGFVSEIIDEFRPDVVHTNVGPLDVALDACVERGIPHVWHLREFQAGMRFWPSRTAFRKKIHHSLNRSIAITSCVAEYWGLRDVDTVIYDGVKVDVQQDRQLRLSEDYLLSVGRIEKNKGVLELLRAYRIYRKKGGTARLKIVGRSSLLYGLRCRIYARLHKLGSSVEFLGHRDDVSALMSAAAALVVSSVTEGFGLASVEAMLCGCPVIGNDSTGMKEQFDIGREFTGQEIGLRYRGAAQLAERMLEVTSEQFDRGQMCLGAKETVISKYNLSDRVDDLEKYYLSILEVKKCVLEY